MEGVSSSDLCQLISTTIAETFVIHPHKDVRISLLDNYNPSRSAFDANTVTLKTVTDFVDNKDIQVQDIESIHRVTLVYWQLRLQNYGILDVTADKLNSTQMHVEQHSTPDCLLELLSLIVRLLSSPNSHTVETKAKLKSTLLHLLHFGAEDCLSLFRLLREDSKECWDFHDSLGLG